VVSTFQRCGSKPRLSLHHGRIPNPQSETVDYRFQGDLVVSILTYFKIAGVVAIATTIGLGYWHYTSVLSDRQSLSEALAASKIANDLAIQTANNNAAATKALEATYKVQIAALEILAAETAAAEALSRSFADDLATAEDIEIPDALAKPFLKRFGGAR
jgi:hypothetical protein